MKYKFNASFIKKLNKLDHIDFKLLTIGDKVLEDDVVLGKEGAATVLRICENSPNPLDVYITTKKNYKVYNKEGELFKYIDNRYYTEDDFINYLKGY